MKNKEQTAVDFLITELNIGQIVDREKLYVVAEILKKAKQMEKEQIIYSYMADRYPCSKYDAEQYYFTYYGK